MLERVWVFGYGVDAVYVAAPELAQEGCWKTLIMVHCFAKDVYNTSKHSLELDAIEGLGVFSCSLERVECGIEVARLSLYI